MTKHERKLVEKWEALGLFERLSENSIKRVLVAKVLERTFTKFKEHVSPNQVVPDTVVLELKALGMFEEDE